MTSVALRWLCFGSVLLLLVRCADPGCLRNSECDKGLECRDDVCQRPLPHDAEPNRDGGVSPLYDAATTETQSPAAPLAADSGVANLEHWEPPIAAAKSGDIPSF